MASNTRHSANENRNYINFILTIRQREIPSLLDS